MVGRVGEDTAWVWHWGNQLPVSLIKGKENHLRARGTSKSPFSTSNPPSLPRSIDHSTSSSLSLPSLFLPLNPVLNFSPFSLKQVSHKLGPERAPRTPLQWHLGLVLRALLLSLRDGPDDEVMVRQWNQVARPGQPHLELFLYVTVEHPPLTTTSSGRFAVKKPMSKKSLRENKRRNTEITEYFW